MCKARNSVKARSEVTINTLFLQIIIKNQASRFCKQSKSRFFGKSGLKIKEKQWKGKLDALTSWVSVSWIFRQVSRWPFENKSPVWYQKSETVVIRNNRDNWVFQSSMSVSRDRGKVCGTHFRLFVFLRGLLFFFLRVDFEIISLHDIDTESFAERSAEQNLECRELKRIETTTYLLRLSVFSFFFSRWHLNFSCACEYAGCLSFCKFGVPNRTLNTVKSRENTKVHEKYTK